MHEALVVFSRAGLFQTSILANDVRSREHARKLWPLVMGQPLVSERTLPAPFAFPLFANGSLV